MSSGKWRPFCLGLSVLMFLIWNIYIMNELWIPNLISFIVDIWSNASTTGPWYTLIIHGFSAHSRYLAVNFNVISRINVIACFDDRNLDYKNM